MGNTDLQRVWTYHDGSKHSLQSIRAGKHYLDWQNQPIPFKIYPSLQPILLPREAGQTGVTALSAISERVRAGGPDLTPTLEDLARILYFSAGITKMKRYTGGEIFFRAASCTGALYEIELYLVCGELPGLTAGVYHFGPEDLGLRLLRTGDFRPDLVEATGEEDAVAHAPLTMVCTGTYWRNAWKYQARTYRHFGWDNGTMLANMLAMCTALRLVSRVICGFVDAKVNRLLDVDDQREVAFSMVTIGRTADANRPFKSDISPLNYETVRLSQHDVDYPAMREMHAASTLETPDEVRQWRPASASGGRVPQPIDSSADDSIERVILRRGSSRRFKRESISLDQLHTILRSSTRGIDSDFLQSPSDQLNDLYLIVNAVDGLESGAYFYEREREGLVLLKSGDFRNEAQYLGLQQALPGDASAAIFLLADLHAIFARLGNRGYRAVQLEAGIMGGRMYIAAYAQRLGATGLTFFDDDVVDFFSPHAARKSAIFLVAVGRGAK